MLAQIADRVLLRPMTLGDLDAATELSREQRWLHREEDLALFLELGESIVAELDGRVVGTIMSWRFGDDFATLGSVIVSKVLRGCGIGRKLVETMLERLKGRNVLLNATDEGLSLYRKLGFVEIGTVLQHQGPAPAMPLAELAPGERVRPTGAADDCLPELYSRACGMSCDGVFSSLLDHGKTVVLTQEHQPVGFAMFRRFGRGWTIAPVVAADERGAKILISHWLNAKRHALCRLDVPEDSGLSEWLEMRGIPKVNTVRTMVLGSAPVADPHMRVFGFATRALG